jgi:hypothetical protein
MPARRVPTLTVPVDARAGASFRGYEHRTPLLTITTGAPALLVTLTLPEQIEAGHVEFARQLACHAWAYAVAVERQYRGLPPLSGPPVPHVLAARPDTWTRGPGQRNPAGHTERQEATA